MLNEKNAKTAFKTIMDVLRKGGFTVKLYKNDHGHQAYGVMCGKSISICTKYDYPTRINTLISLVTNYYASQIWHITFTKFEIRENPKFYMVLTDRPKRRHEYRLDNTLDNSTALMVHHLFNTGVIEYAEAH